jgi:hypothetical protein
VKQFRNHLRSVSVGCALLLAAGVAAADPLAGLTATSTAPHDLIGSDTLEDVTRAVLNSLRADGLLAANGITAYQGLGSSAGQRQMEGSPSGEEPACTPNDNDAGTEGNPGCEEIAPMSRQLDSKICEDDGPDPRIPGDPTANNTAEGLAACLDGLAVIVDDMGHHQYADDASGCPSSTSTLTNPWLPASPNLPIPADAVYAKSGKLRSSGTITTDGGASYTFGGGALTGLSAWKDVLRVIYTGCNNTDGTCPNTIDRNTRCSSDLRATVLNHYNYIFASGDVAGDTAVHCTQPETCAKLRQAYRRDDSSGTTTMFLQFLGLRNGGGDLAGRARYIGTLSASNQILAATQHIYCDAGDLEGMWYNDNTATTIGDPIQRPCAAEDDLCNKNGTMGVVRAIRSPKDPNNFPNYPAYQCKRGAFALKQFINTKAPVCPDGTAPVQAGKCYMPYFPRDMNGDGDTLDAVDRDFNCLNDAISRSPTSPATVDGRVWNYLMHVVSTTDGDLNGTVIFTPKGAGVQPEVAQWRQNMAVMNTAFAARNGGHIGQSPIGTTQQYFIGPNYNDDTTVTTDNQFTNTYTDGVVCQQGSSTTLIGCIVGNTRCTMGFIGREGAIADVWDKNQEAVRLQNQHPDPLDPSKDFLAPSDEAVIAFDYAFTRELFLNAIGGFENITADCKVRNGLAIGDPVTPDYCLDEVTLATEFYNNSARVQSACTAAGFIPIPGGSVCRGATGPATCGAPTQQPLNACQPQ